MVQRDLLPGAYGIGAAANDDVVEMAAHNAGEDPAGVGNRYFIAAAAVYRNSQARVGGDLLRCDRPVGRAARKSWQR